MNVKEKKSIVIKEKILETAAQQFAAGGFSGARVDEIAASAKVNKGTIYYQIGNKRELYRQVFIHCFEKLFQEILASVSACETTEEKIRTYISTLGNVLANKVPDLARIIMFETAAGGNHLPNEAILYMGKIQQILIDVLEQGSDADEFNSSNPFLLHLISIGSLIFFICGEDVRKKAANTWLKDAPNNFTPPIDEIVNDLSNLILGYLQK